MGAPPTQKRSRGKYLQKRGEIREERKRKEKGKSKEKGEREMGKKGRMKEEERQWRNENTRMKGAKQQNDERVEVLRYYETVHKGQK